MVVNECYDTIQRQGILVTRMPLCACYEGNSSAVSTWIVYLIVLQDPITAKRQLTKYSSLDTTFASTLEAKFVNILVDAIEAGDLEMFTAAVFEFDQVMKLDNWKTGILLKIKKTIDEEPSLT